MSERYYLEKDIKEIVKNLRKYKNKIYGKKFFITGANGFLGKYFIKVINELNKQTNKKIKVIANDIKFDNCEIFYDKNVKIIKKDINKIYNFNYKCDYILHAAGIPSPKNYFKKPIETIFTSITSTKNLLEYSAKKNQNLFFLVAAKFMVIQIKKISLQKKHIMEMFHL